MQPRDDEALQADAYIDALLTAHAGGEVIRPELQDSAPVGLRRTIELLEAGLPRFHPSFLFEEALAARLRAAALGEQPARDDDLLLSELIELPVARAAAGAVALDRRLLLGGAIASGVSLAGAAVVAWRMRERARPRRRWLT